MTTIARIARPAALTDFDPADPFGLDAEERNAAAEAVRLYIGWAEAADAATLADLIGQADF